MGTQSVKDILDTEIPKPTFSLVPSQLAPLNNYTTYSRGSVSNGDFQAQTVNPTSGYYKGADGPRVFGKSQGLLVEGKNKKQWHDARQPPNGAWPNTYTDTAGRDGIDGDNSNFDGTLLKDNSQRIDSQISVPDSTDDTWSISLWVHKNQSPSIMGFDFKVVWDSGNNFERVDVNLNNGTIDSRDINDGSFHIQESYNTDWWRLVAILPSPANVTNKTAGVRIYTDYGDIRIDNLQIEKDANTSPIFSSGSPTTRGGDNVTVDVNTDWFNDREGTFLFEFEILSYRFGGRFRFGSPESWFQVSGENVPPYKIESNNSDPTVGIGTVGVKERSKYAISVTPSQRILSLNGTSSIFGNDGTLLSPGSYSLGEGGGGSIVFYKINYYPRALPESTLNTLTS